MNVTSTIAISNEILRGHQGVSFVPRLSDPALLAALLRSDPAAVQQRLLLGDVLGPLEAAAIGDLDCLERLLGRDVDLGGSSCEGWFALHIAAWFGHTEVVQWLLDLGVPVDLPAVAPGYITGCTALHLSVAANRNSTTELLLAAGADTGRRDEAGWTALHIAAERGYLPMVKALLMAGAELNPICGDSTPLGLALRAPHRHVCALLRQLGGLE